MPREETLPAEEVVAEEKEVLTEDQEVLAPEAEQVEEQDKEQGKEQVESEEAEGSPTAEELLAQLQAKEEEIERLKSAKTDEVETPAPKPQERVSVASVFMNQYVPHAKKQYASTVSVNKETGEISVDTEKQFEVMADTANRLVGAVMADQVMPNFQQLAVANITLANEIAIRDLRAEEGFKELEPEIRKQLAKVDWKGRAEETVVQDIYHRLRGKKSTVVTGKAKIAPKTPPQARAVLKDLAAGGGVAPKAAGVRLSQAQEKDYQEMIENGWSGTRTEYFAKYKARADAAKAKGLPAPATYRG